MRAVPWASLSCSAGLTHWPSVTLCFDFRTLQSLSVLFSLVSKTLGRGNKPGCRLKCWKSCSDLHDAGELQSLAGDGERLERPVGSRDDPESGMPGSRRSPHFGCAPRRP